MQPNSEPLNGPTDESAAVWAELIVQNGRLSGTRKALTAPIITIGRAESCDLRLNVESVHSCHCVLASGPTGPSLRNLQVDNGTLVNGQPVIQCDLREGDQLSIGPFQFQVHLAGQRATAGGESLEREKQALRIQAAAVAAQQAALTEEEIRLQQRREALQHQEQQLAAHLEEKRQRLVRLRDEAREAHAALQQVRTAYEERVAQIMDDLAQSRRELANGQNKLQTERRHLLDLRRRLKRRFHRHWLSERATMQHREAELAKQQRVLKTQTEQLQQEKASLMQAQLRFNGDAELSRRNLEADWQHLRQQQAELLEQTGALDERDRALAGREQELGEQRRRWETLRLQLQQEAEGLENRIANSRRKLFDLEQERNRLFSASYPSVRDQASQDAPAATLALPKDVLPAASLLPFGSQWLQREQRLHMLETELASRLGILQQAAGDLNDQRLYLAEQYERLALAKQQWQQEHEAVAMGLETIGQRLCEREDAVQHREQAVAAAERELQQRLAALAQAQRQYESGAAGFAAEQASWRGEQKRLQASLRAREDLVAQRLTALIQLRERWDKRRQRQLCRWRTQRSTCEELGRESEAQRQEWLRRSTLLAKEQRTLAERALALEQYRQRWISRAANPKAAEKRLERFRRRWAALAVSAERALAQERKALENQAARLEARARQVQQDADEVTGLEAELSTRQAAWEQQQLQDQAEHERLRQEVYCLRAQRQADERQLETLREEVERLARFLLDGNEPTPLPIPQAA